MTYICIFDQIYLFLGQARPRVLHLLNSILIKLCVLYFIGLISCSSGELNIKDSRCGSSRQQLLEQVPLLANAIIVHTDGSIVSPHIRHVIEAILNRMERASAKCSPPTPDQFGEPEDNPLEFFPCFPTTL